MFWLYHDRTVQGPLGPEELLQKTHGSLEVLVAASDLPPKSRWEWKLGFLFQELVSKSQALQAARPVLVTSNIPGWRTS